MDASSQYTPYLNYFKDIFTGKSSIFYSLSKSLGGEMYGLFTYYLISPFNLISLFLKKEFVPIAFYLIMVLKNSFAGLSFYWFLNRGQKPKVTNLIFSCMYALSSSAITYGFNIMWLDSLILLPIICVGIEDIVYSKRNLIYVIALTLTLITNYYMGFIMCIFSGMYFVYKLVLNVKDNKKEKIRKFGRFIMLSIIAVLIACVILVPVMIGLKDGRINDARGEVTFKKNFVLTNGFSKFFTNSFGGSEIGNTEMPPVFCGVLANYLVLLFFMNKKISKEEKLYTSMFLLIFFTSFYIQGLNISWVMGNEPACFKYRYIFCFTFLYIMIANKSLKNIKDGVKSWQMLLSAGIIFLIGVFVLQKNLENTNSLYVKLDIAFVFVIYILMEISRLDLSKNKFLGQDIQKIVIITIILLSTLNLIFNTFDSLKIIMKGLSKETMKEYIETSRDYQNRYETIENFDKGLYRIESKANLTINDGLAFGFNGVNYSGSTYSKGLTLFLRNLGYSQQHVAVSSDGGNTKAMDMLFGVKYVADREKALGWRDYEEKRINDRIFYENKYALNLGLGTSKSILKDVEFNILNCFENQNSLLKNIANMEEDVFEKQEGRITIKLINLEERYDKESNTNRMLGIIDVEKPAEAIYEFETEKSGECYFYISAGKNLEYVDIYVNGKMIDVKYIGNHNKMIQLGRHEIGDKIKIEFKLIATELGIYDTHIYYENDEVLKKYYDILSANQMELQKVSNRKYEGTINLQEDNEYVLFTIPYDKGWQAKVDGKSVEIVQVQDMLMAVKCGSRRTYGRAKIYATRICNWRNSKLCAVFVALQE